MIQTKKKTVKLRHTYLSLIVKLTEEQTKKRQGRNCIGQNKLIQVGHKRHM